MSYTPVRSARRLANFFPFGDRGLLWEFYSHPKLTRSKSTRVLSVESRPLLAYWQPRDNYESANAQLSGKGMHQRLGSQYFRVKLCGTNESNSARMELR